jgi:hypothetical protein
LSKTTLAKNITHNSMGAMLLYGAVLAALLPALLATNAAPARTLAQIFVVSQHGVSTPFTTVPGVHVQWDSAPGALTPDALRSGYELGRALRRLLVTGDDEYARVAGRYSGDVNVKNVTQAGRRTGFFFFFFFFLLFPLISPFFSRK